MKKKPYPSSGMERNVKSIFVSSVMESMDKILKIHNKTFGKKYFKKASIIIMPFILYPKPSPPPMILKVIEKNFSEEK